MRTQKESSSPRQPAQLRQIKKVLSPHNHPIKSPPRRKRRVESEAGQKSQTEIHRRKSQKAGTVQQIRIKTTIKFPRRKKRKNPFRTKTIKKKVINHLSLQIRRRTTTKISKPATHRRKMRSWKRKKIIQKRTHQKKTQKMKSRKVQRIQLIKIILPNPRTSTKIREKIPIMRLTHPTKARNLSMKLKNQKVQSLEKLLPYPTRTSIVNLLHRHRSALPKILP